jgi:hypothetical protein
MFWQGFFTGLGVGAIIFGVWVGLIAQKQLALEAALGNLLYESLTELRRTLQRVAETHEDDGEDEVEQVGEGVL